MQATSGGCSNTSYEATRQHTTYARMIVDFAPPSANSSSVGAEQAHGRCLVQKVVCGLSSIVKGEALGPREQNAGMCCRLHDSLLSMMYNTFFGEYGRRRGWTLRSWQRRWRKPTSPRLDRGAHVGFTRVWPVAT